MNSPESRHSLVAIEWTTKVQTIRAAGRIENRPQLKSKSLGALTKQSGFSGDLLNSVAIVDFGQRKIGLYLTESFLGTNNHKKIYEWIDEKNYILADERIAMSALIAELNGSLKENQEDNEVASVEQIAKEMIEMAIDAGTSDIHLCRRKNHGQLLFRENREVVRKRSYPAETCDKAFSWMYGHMSLPSTRSHGDVNLTVKSQQCMIQYEYAKKLPDGRPGQKIEYTLRVKFLTTFDGWDAVIRIQNGSDDKTPLESLGYLPSQVALLQEAAEKTKGLVILSGKTNSGKSTALKACCEINSEHTKLLKKYTLEDPVENKLYGWSQISVRMDEHTAGDGDAAIAGHMKDLLRADPDVIMVGEIRGTTTAALVTDFVFTGHKCLTTLHASSGMGIIPRLNRLGVENQFLADKNFITLLGYQKLMPIICPTCRKPAEGNLSESKLNAIRSRFGIDTSSVWLRNYSSPDTCDSGCKRGVTHVSLVAEIIEFDMVMRDSIGNGNYIEAEKYWRSTRNSNFNEPDMTGKTIYEHAIYRMSIGEIDPRDIERELDSALEKYEILPLARS